MSTVLRKRLRAARPSSTPDWDILGKDAIVWHAGDRKRLNIGGQVLTGTEGSPLTKPTSRGLGAAWTRTGSAGVNFGVRQPLNTFAAVTFMLFAAPVSIAQIKATHGQRQVASSYQFELVVNCNDSFIATAGAMTLVSFNGEHGDTYIANAGIDGLPHCWVISNTSSSSAYAYRDGLPLTITRNAPTVSCIGVFQEYCIGNIGAYTTDGTYANDDPMMIAIAWPRQIPERLARQLSEHPMLAFQARRVPIGDAPLAITVFHPGSDISVAGWTASTGTDLFACVDEPTAYNDADYITSPDLTTSAVMGWDNPVPAGTWSLAIRPMFPEGASGQIRLVMLDSGSSSVGSSAWQALTGAFVTYTLAITTTGVSDRFRLEIQP